MKTLTLAVLALSIIGMAIRYHDGGPLPLCPPKCTSDGGKTCNCRPDGTHNQGVDNPATVK